MHQKHRLILVAGAVAAALATPYAAAQYRTDRTEAYRAPADSNWGYRADPGAWIQTDPAQYDGRRTWYAHPRAHIGPDNAYHSPTDGRSGGAGIPAPNGVVPSTSPLVSSGEPPYPPSRLIAGEYPDRRAAAPSRSTDPQVNPERSSTDGRSGGTGVPSSSSGAVPSTQPQEDAGTAPRGAFERDAFRRDVPPTTTVR